MLEIGN